LPAGHILLAGRRQARAQRPYSKLTAAAVNFFGGETMSTVSGTITRKNKSGRTVSKTKLGVKTRRNKPIKIPPVKALEFISKVKALAKRYQIQIDNLKIT
jgi:hypothetical protein